MEHKLQHDDTEASTYQCCFKVGQASQTLAKPLKHWNSIGVTWIINIFFMVSADANPALFLTTCDTVPWPSVGLLLGQQRSRSFTTDKPWHAPFKPTRPRFIKKWLLVKTSLLKYAAKSCYRRKSCDETYICCYGKERRLVFFLRSMPVVYISMWS